MPSISQAISISPQSHLQPMAPLAQAPGTLASAINEPTLNTFLRSPLPLVFDSPSTDSLRQFYRDGIPQMRLFTPNLHPIYQG